MGIQRINKPAPVVLLTERQWEVVILLADILAHLPPEDRRLALEVALDAAKDD